VSARDPRYVPDERVIDALYWQAKTNCPWRFLPPWFPSKSTVFERRARWISAGVFDTLMMLTLVDCPELGLIDATFIECKAPLAERGWTKIGNGIKVQALCDGNGRLSSVIIDSAGPGEANMARRFECLPSILIGDSAYDTLALREHARELDCELVTTNNWPGRKQSLDEREVRAAAKRERWPIERTFGWLKSFRAVGTCYARSVETYLVSFSLATANYNLRSA